MGGTVELPVWLFATILVFAAVTFLSHFLLPSVRWFFRRRLERAVARLNARLAVPIRPFILTRRFDLVQRLAYDSRVLAAVAEHARAHGVPEALAFERARRHAREIVPAFSAFVYFGLAIRLARWVSRAHYDVAVTVVDEAALQAIPPDATVVFVMNHRSNMDYVLLTHLVADRSTLSYAVGEWARVWPLRALVRAMGGYFIRRRETDALYRAVLARYVGMATASGVTQAVFPEGRLSLDGRMGAPRLGLLRYVAQGAAEAGRPVVFVPVALAYDRVVEDRFLVAAAETGQRRFRGATRRGLAVVARGVLGRLAGRPGRLGRAGVAFARPVPLAPGEDLRRLGPRLMAEIDRTMPRLPVPLVADALLSLPGPVPEDRLRAAVALRLAVPGPAPLTDPAAAVAEGLARCRARGLVRDVPGGVAIVAGRRALLAYYANALGAGQPAIPPEPELAGT